MEEKHSSISPAWVYATVFGCLWGAMEVTLGTFLHAVRMPLAGVWMASLGTVIIVAAQWLRPARWQGVRIGIVCMLMKLISPGVVIVIPMIAIFMEALGIALVLGNKRPSLFRALFAGGLVTFITIIQNIIAAWLIFGWDILRIYYVALKRILNWADAAEHASFWVIALLVVVIILIGMAAGFLGRKLGRKVEAQKKALERKP